VTREVFHVGLVINLKHKASKFLQFFVPDRAAGTDALQDRILSCSHAFKNAFF
jgi:hypothetical protein